MAGKVYAVRKGYQTGKFYDWNVVKGLVTGYKGAEYKSFSGVNAEVEANCYLGINTGSSVIKFENVNNTSPDYKPFEPYDNPYKCDDESCIAFVDGSWDKKTKQFSYGVVLFTKKDKHCLSGCDGFPALAEMHNVAGELLGAMIAIRKAESLGMKKLMIVHDYEGTAEWVATDHKAWQANKWGTSMYQRFVFNHRKNINIVYKWVKGHSGVEHNEEADKLASNAIKNSIRCDSESVFKDLD